MISRAERRKINIAIKKLRLSGDDLSVARILLFSAHLGADEMEIARHTHLTRGYVYDVGERLRSNRVWVGKKLNVNWTDDQGIGLLCDVLVGQGFLKRAHE